MLQRWNVESKNKIYEKFYLFDCNFFMEDLALKRFELVANVYDLIIEDLSNIDESNDKLDISKLTIKDQLQLTDQSKDKVDDQVNQSKDKVDDKRCKYCEDGFIEKAINKKKEFASIIDNFNRNGNLPDSFQIKYLRISPLTDLKALGKFLCKEKNLDKLIEFAESFDFYKIDMLEALRIFLSSFYLIGESQIIERVLTVFTKTYLKSQNDQNITDQNISDQNINNQFSSYKQLFYSFIYIVLNTMLFNPSIEKRPSFEDYLRLMDYKNDFIIPKDTIKEYYFSIKNTEIKLPTIWEDSLDKYKLYLSIKNDSKDNNSNIQYDSKDNNSVSICKGCAVRAYKVLFTRSFNNCIFLEPDEFFNICDLLDLKNIYENYIKINKNNLGKCISAFKNHIESFEGNLELYSLFISVIEKTKKPSSIFLGNNKNNSILPPFSAVVENILNMKFKNEFLCNNNIKLLYKNNTPFFRTIVNAIIINNIELINDITFMDTAVIHKLLDHKLLDHKSDHINDRFIEDIKDIDKISYIKNRINNHGNEVEIYRLFRKIEVFNNDTFEIFCFYLHFYDIFYDYTTINPITNNTLDDSILKNSFTNNTSTSDVFVVVEKFKDQLRSSENILKLYSSTNSILNIKKVMKIHKNGCPLKDEFFLDFNRIVYLIYKCNVNDVPLFNYTLYIINYLSDSLILLCDIYFYIYSMFYKIDPTLRNSLVKIFIKRLKLFYTNGISCCNETNNSTSKIEDLKEKLINDNFINKQDLIGDEKIVEENKKEEVMDL